MTLQNFKREFFVIIFNEDYYKYIYMLANKGCDDIYSTLYKALGKIKIKFFKENFSVNENKKANKNYDKALLEYRRQCDEWGKV